MDWLNETTKYLRSDLNSFAFCPGEPFHVRSVTLIAKNGRVEDEVKKFQSETEFTQWIERFSPRQDQPTFTLIVHERHNDAASSLTYSKDTFMAVSRKLYQHRSLVWSMQRTSTSIFNYKRTSLTLDEPKEEAIVYNCRSDTDTLKFDEDIVLSTTYFRSRPWVFSAIYGYPSYQADYLVARLTKFPKPAFHPLMMPMVFAEHERSRFMEVMELKGPKLQQRIMDLKRWDQFEISHFRNVMAKGSDEMMRDLWNIEVRDDVSRLKIGMESFRKVLAALEEQFETFKHLQLQSHIQATDEEVADSISSEYIRCRLKEMDAEIDGNIRKCEGLLAGMTLAIQIEWNYHTRQDAKANIFIARASHQDSTQMTMLSWVGMIFLPATFLATFFSMPFFQWIPDDSPQMISPWVCIYIGLTAIVTGIILWLWRQRTKSQPELGDLSEYLGV